MTDDPEVARLAAHQALARGDTLGGIASYQRVLELAPRDVDARAQLAHAFERGHDLAAARAHAQAALAIDPRANIARVALARVLMREKNYEEAEWHATQITSDAHSSDNDRAVAWGIVGDARDLSGDARGAFTAFSAANALYLKKHHALRDDASHLYHPSQVRNMERFVSQADVRSWRRPSAFATKAPVFLVGFPRSGTTLLDQVLSSHAHISCLEETEHLAFALAAVFKSTAKLAAMGSLTDGEIETIREAYWRNVGETSAEIVVDKLPLNIVVLPLIKAVFPDAKVIVALRDPRDVVLSCYQHRFGMNVAMAQFLELDRTAIYYGVVMSLLERCLERLHLNVHRVRYEDVVTDLERQARALVEFLELDFDPAMLDFHKTALGRDIKTPSARQVTQPLYNRSVGRWRRYAEDLAPVLPQLQAWAERLGYA
ncbi:MAG: sulfotransferase [Hyphomonadaceae bacterium]